MNDLRDQLCQAIIAESSHTGPLMRRCLSHLNDVQSSRHAPPLHLAASWGRDEVVDQLLEAGADVNLVCPHDVDGAYRCTALDLALLHRHSSTSQLLLDRGATRNFLTYVGMNDVQATHDAVTRHPGVLREERFFPGCLPIHFAAAACSNAMIDLLCELGADVNARDAAGHSPLRYACLHFRGILVLQTLYVHGAELNNIANDGTTPLTAACTHYETVPAVRWLLENGADANLADHNGKTPLMLAAEHGISDAVTLLLKHGAHISHRAASGATAIDVAKQQRYSEIVRLLLRAC